MSRGLLPLTREIAVASGETQANKRMRAAGRSAWDRDDYNAAVFEQARVALSLGGMDEVASREVLRTFGKKGRDVLRAFDAGRSAA